MGDRWLLVIGGTSDIAIATERIFASKGFNVAITARNKDYGEKVLKDLEIRYGIETKLYLLDILDFESHEKFVKKLDFEPSIILCAVGYLGDQELAEHDFKEARKIIDTNYTGCVSIIERLIPLLNGGNTIIGISSVAGDRVRRKNYFYGSAKAGFSGYLSGLRGRLYTKSIKVITVKPGFVRTKMTANMKLPKLITAEPEDVAKDIYRAYEKGKEIIYSKWFWKYIMLTLKLIPESLWKRLTF